MITQLEPACIAEVLHSGGGGVQDETSILHLFSDFDGKLDNRKYKMEVLACHFLQLVILKIKGIQISSVIMRPC